MADITKSPGPTPVHALTSRLSLAAKLYSIFALFAVLVAAITALSDYNSRQNAALTDAVATASRAAINVERVNSLVYAVVMESRGVYMSTDPAVVKKYGEGLLKFNERILEVVKSWQALVQADDPSSSRLSRSASNSSSTSARNWSAAAWKSAPRRTRMGRQRRQLRGALGPNKDPRRFQVYPSAARNWRSKPTPTT